MKFWIREAREAAGYAQNEMAAKIGVAANTLHGYETGKHDPKSDLLVKIALVCNVTVDFLLKGPDARKAAPLEPLSKSEASLVLTFRECSEEVQSALLLLARASSQAHELTDNALSAMAVAEIERRAAQAYSQSDTPVTGE